LDSAGVGSLHGSSTEPFPRKGTETLETHEHQHKINDRRVQQNPFPARGRKLLQSLISGFSFRRAVQQNPFPARGRKHGYQSSVLSYQISISSTEPFPRKGTETLKFRVASLASANLVQQNPFPARGRKLVLVDIMHVNQVLQFNRTLSPQGDGNLQKIG